MMMLIDDHDDKKVHQCSCILYAHVGFDYLESGTSV